MHLFRFEEAWVKDDRCEDLIKEAWRRTPNQCTEKLQAVQTIDETFKEYRTGAVSKEIKRIEELLKDTNLWSSEPTSVQAYKTLEKQRDNLLRTDEVLWRQRSMAVWLKDGDRNTKIFHSKADQRRKANAIKKLKDVDGVWWKGDDHLERLLTSYFSDIFTTSSPSNIEEECETVKGKLTPKHADRCGAAFTDKEIEDAIFHMHPLKGPGPDGLPALFFQKFCHIVGRDVKAHVKEILNHSRDPEDINKTFIALIPKGKNPASSKDFRPISLCNVVMKIVTKTIANRIKQILPDIIDEEQNAFVKGRLITDNALIAMECFHWLKKKKKGKKGMMALKLDMSKAYDRIEWNFVVFPWASRILWSN